MLVVKNCAINRNEKFDLDDLKINYKQKRLSKPYTLFKLAIVLPLSSASIIERDIIFDSEKVLNIFSLTDKMLKVKYHLAKT